MKRVFYFSFVVSCGLPIAQELPLLDRLQLSKTAIEIFMRLMAIPLPMKDLKLPFDEKGFKKAYRKLKINAQDAQPNPRILTDN